jgi:NADPH-dependent 2,4-dienoyl-CoA reductase/sulfur reductase-like enzyme
MEVVSFRFAVSCVLMIFIFRESHSFSATHMVQGRHRQTLNIRGSNMKTKQDPFSLRLFNTKRTRVVADQTMSSSLNNNCKVVVLGGGFGGLYTALNLAKLSKLPEQNFGKVEITLVDSSDR